MIATRCKQRLDSDIVRLPNVESLLGKNVEIIVIEDLPVEATVAANPREGIFGSAKDDIWISPDFNKPLPDDILNGFYK